MFHPSINKLCIEATHCKNFLGESGKCNIFNDRCKYATVFETASIRRKLAFSMVPARERVAGFSQSRDHSLPQSAAVRSIAFFSFVTISSISLSQITSGGASTIVSRIARQMRPSLKQ